MKIKFGTREYINEVMDAVVRFYGGIPELEYDENENPKIGLATIEKDGIEVDDTDICIDLLMYLQDKYDCQSTDILDEDPEEAKKYKALFKD